MPPHERYRSGDHSLLRKMNLSAILHHLVEPAPISRASLAAVTGLNKAPVSSLVRELLEHGFIRETGVESTGMGCPAVLLDLNPGAGCIISAEVGVGFILVIRADFAVNINWRHYEAIKPEIGQEAILQRLTNLVRQAVDVGRFDCDNLFGIAVGVPGLVDQATGELLFAPNLQWRDVPIRALLRAAFDAPVFVNNEANLAALGEHYSGAAQGYQEILCFSAGEQTLLSTVPALTAAHLGDEIRFSIVPERLHYFYPAGRRVG